MSDEREREERREREWLALAQAFPKEMCDLLRAWQWSEGKISSEHIEEFKRILAYKFAAVYFGLHDVAHVDKIVISPDARLVFNQAADEVCDFLRDGVDLDEIEAILAQRWADLE
jgi:hypothetical protein